MIFDDRIEKGKNITFDNKLTRNFLKNTQVDFLGIGNGLHIFPGS